MGIRVVQLAGFEVGRKIEDHIVWRIQIWDWAANDNSFLLG